MKQTEIYIGFHNALVALADVQRRKLLIELLEHDQQKDPPAVISGTDNNWFSQSVSMHHAHLPKLAGAGLIDWDSEIQVVRKGPQFDKVRPVLRALQNHRDELPVGYLLEDDSAHV